MAKQNKPASVYAPPHTMTGKRVSVQSVKAGVESAKKYMKDTPVVVANTRSQEYEPEKTSGIKVRGTGAATKGLMARGPMA